MIVIDEDNEYTNFIMKTIAENEFEEVVIPKADGKFKIND